MQVYNSFQNNNFAFGALKIKQPDGIKYIEKNSPSALGRLDEIKREFAEHNYWDLLVDGDGYKLACSRTNKIYTVPVNPKKHSKKDSPQLLIRTFNPNAKRKNLISFPVYYKTIEEVRKVYSDIVHATGLDKMLLVVRALEK